MREWVKKNVRHIAVLSLVSLFSIAPVRASLASARAEPGRDTAGDRQQVLAVIASRTHNEKILEKFKDKLEVLSSRKLRLAVSLCDRVARHDDTAGADIAFSLLTVLVVLS